jgi:ubiquinone/menaquinone biosynthesis C-methylase UbiE
MNSSISTLELQDQNIAQSFYEDRYKDDYMDDWPQWKKQRIVSLIEKLNLPKSGKALDFGCGRGIFTQVLKSALPEWEITGCDISKFAMEAGRIRFPNCRFEEIFKLQQENEKFDLIFSHHVLEHVSKIDLAISDISSIQTSDGLIFHVMPCGNKSFEYDLASSIPNGINKEIDNRFYYEDKGHLRRLTSNEMDNLVSAENYFPEKQWFANHLYGSLEWMTDSSDEFIKEILCNVELAEEDQQAKKTLIALQRRISRLKIARQFAKEGLKHRVKTRLINIKTSPISFLNQLIQLLKDIKLYNEGIEFNDKLYNEWALENEQPNGSEMYLVYKKRV